MKRSMVVSLILSIFVAVGCSTNPVTGKQEISLVSESWEINQGKELYAPMRQSQGGDYKVDPQVSAYVSEVGQKLAKVSDRKLPYEFEVINNSEPNAWALPGGKIAINRGLLQELESEAELAAVLGHEIVHAAAKHSAQGMQRGLLLQGLVLATAVSTQNKDYASLAQIGSQVGAQMINQKYGRDDERESDKYGMLYMSRAGYDPQGAVDLQKKFVELSKSKRQDWLSGLLSSHPASEERVENNKQIAAGLKKGGTIGKERYQKMMARLKKDEPAYEKYNAAQKALAKKDYSTARSLAQQAVKMQPREGHFHSLLGDIEFSQKDFKSAINYYNKAIQQNSNFYHYYLARGIANEELNNNAAAKSDLEKSLKMLPTPHAYQALGDIAKEEGRLNEAQQYYAKASGGNGQTAQAASASFSSTDFARNPGKYIRAKAGLDRYGKLAVEITNTTNASVTGLRLQILFPDSRGQMRQATQALQGSLKPGESSIVAINVPVNRAYLNRVKAQVTQARILK